MEKLETRNVIKFLHLKDYNAQKIQDERRAVCGIDGSSYDIVVSWGMNFQTGCLPLKDDSSSERSFIDDILIERREFMQRLR
ncbi:hypothetical protein TNCV_3479731 [Trichonephila clavipes]|nr:hypothetical protein TNCV_3479731 [Trichonephila clavipes]